MSRNTARERVNPFASDSAEHTLFSNYRRHILAVSQIDEQLAYWQGERTVAAAKAHGCAEALRALGHGDKLPGQKALPAPSDASAQ